MSTKWNHRWYLDFLLNLSIPKIFKSGKLKNWAPIYSPIPKLFHFLQTGLKIFFFYLNSSGLFTCSRKVSTVVCAHEPDCIPKDCNGHGQCVMGECLCNSHWTGGSCNVLKCRQHNCSSNGNCTTEGEITGLVCWKEYQWHTSMQWHTHHILPHFDIICDLFVY